MHELLLPLELVTICDPAPERLFLKDPLQCCLLDWLLPSSVHGERTKPHREHHPRKSQPRYSLRTLRGNLLSPPMSLSLSFIDRRAARCLGDVTLQVVHLSRPIM